MVCWFIIVGVRDLHPPRGFQPLAPAVLFVDVKNVKRFAVGRFRPFVTQKIL